MAADNLTPKERAVKNYVGGMSPRGKRSLMEDVGKRIRRQAKNPSAKNKPPTINADKDIPLDQDPFETNETKADRSKRLRRERKQLIKRLERGTPEQRKLAEDLKKADNVQKQEKIKNRKPAARMKAKSAKPAKPAKTPPAKMQARSATEPAAKTQTKTAKPEPKIEKPPEEPEVKIEKDKDIKPDKTKSQKVRKILGKGAKQVIKKVAAPLAVLDAAHLAISEDAQQGAKDDFDAMGDDTAALRAVKSVLEPADTIYAAVSALRDAGANVSEPDLES